MLCFPKPVLHAGQGLDDIAVAWYVNVFKSHCRDHILTASAHCTVYATCCFIVSLGICLGTSHTRMGLESSLPVTWQWVSPLGDIIHQPTPSLAKPSCKNHRASLLYQVAMLFWWMTAIWLGKSHGGFKTLHGGQLWSFVLLQHCTCFLKWGPIKSNQIKANQIKSNQIKSNQSTCITIQTQYTNKNNRTYTTYILQLNVSSEVISVIFN